jgi:hypothetical protein
MPLPYFGMKSMPLKNVEPIYSHLFEFVLVTENYHMKELTYELSYVNTIDKNKL